MKKNVSIVKTLFMSDVHNGQLNSSVLFANTAVVLGTNAAFAESENEDAT